MLPPNSNNAPSGSWDSIHVFEATERGRNAHYKLTSTIMLHLVTKSVTSPPGTAKGQQEENAAGSGKGEITLSGSMTRQVSTQQLHDVSRILTSKCSDFSRVTVFHRSSRITHCPIRHRTSRIPGV